MKIYTRTGDRGETGLFGGGRVPKDHARVEAYGAVDELNSVLGVALSSLSASARHTVGDRIRQIQADLFTLGAQLATPEKEDGSRPAHLPELEDDAIERLEGAIDRLEADLPPLRNFILPGGTGPAAHLHLARTVCRRAERRVVHLGHEAVIPEETVVYLNRLSDYLFTAARAVNRLANVPDISWTPREET